jgi:hypothetical protein
VIRRACRGATPLTPPLRAVGTRGEARKEQTVSRLPIGSRMAACQETFHASVSVLCRSPAIQDVTRFGRRANRASFLTTAGRASDQAGRFVVYTLQKAVLTTLYGLI